MGEKELIIKICDEGVVSVKKHEKGSKRRGGLKGFDLARTAKNIADVEKLLYKSQAKDGLYIGKLHDNEITSDEYWEQRYITLQLEHVYKVLQVAHPDQYPMPFASGIKQYARIVGVKSAQPKVRQALKKMGDE